MALYRVVQGPCQRTRIDLNCHLDYGSCAGTNKRMNSNRTVPLCSHRSSFSGSIPSRTLTQSQRHRSLFFSCVRCVYGVFVFGMCNGTMCATSLADSPFPPSCSFLNISFPSLSSHSFSRVLSIIQPTNSQIDDDVCSRLLSQPLFFVSFYFLFSPKRFLFPF